MSSRPRSEYLFDAGPGRNGTQDLFRTAQSSRTNAVSGVRARWRVRQRRLGHLDQRYFSQCAGLAVHTRVWIRMRPSAASNNLQLPRHQRRSARCSRATYLAADLKLSEPRLERLQAPRRKIDPVCRLGGYRNRAREWTELLPRRSAQDWRSPRLLSGLHGTRHGALQWWRRPERLRQWNRQRTCDRCRS